VETAVEIVVLRAIYITEKGIPTVDEKSVKLEVAIDFKGGYTKKKWFSVEDTKAKRINFDRKREH
jgi:hypothetical protein